MVKSQLASRPRASYRSRLFQTLTKASCRRSSAAPRSLVWWAKKLNSGLWKRLTSRGMASGSPARSSLSHSFSSGSISLPIMVNG